jgi:microcystin-dependent protein
MSGYSKYLSSKGACCTPGPQGLRGIPGPQGIPGSSTNTGARGPPGASGVVLQYVYKNSDFSNNLQTTRTSNTPFPYLPTVTGYSCASQGYTSDIKPQKSNNCIKVQFKVKYQTSDIVGTRLDIGVVYTIDGGASYYLLGQDTFCGTNNASYPLTNTYTLNYMHCPNTTNNVTYILFYNIESAATNPLGILGNNPTTTSNCIILEEYAGTGNVINGPTGPPGPPGPDGPSGGIPTGAIMIFGSMVPPSGWLACDGSIVLISDYPNLFLAIGCSFGCVPAPYFVLPDLRGYFVRGWNSGVTGAGGIDSGREFASVQQDQIQPHKHINSNNDCVDYTTLNGVGTGKYNTWCDSDGVRNGAGAALTDDGTYPEQLATGVIGTETRPVNIALLYCIKY